MSNSRCQLVSWAFQLLNIQHFDQLSFEEAISGALWATVWTPRLNCLQSVPWWETGQVAKGCCQDAQNASQKTKEKERDRWEVDQQKHLGHSVAGILYRVWAMRLGHGCFLRLRSRRTRKDLREAWVNWVNRVNYPILWPISPNFEPYLLPDLVTDVMPA